VLVAKRDLAEVSEVNEEEAKEYFAIIKDIESALKKAFDYDKINYLTLMMVDEHVHTHILPRYKEEKTFA
jgi:diadenosine tetraphosphate (Ap4A) HIT family hydrolase